MKFRVNRPGARRFSTRVAKISHSQRTRHPFLEQSNFNRRRFWVRFFGVVSTLVFFSLILLIIFTIFSFLIFAKELLSPYKLTERDASLSTKIYDREGELLYDIFGDKNIALVNWGELPDYVKQATISIEDKNFYKHQGFSPFGIVRAALNIVFLRNLQGGSTITQQVVKNTLLSPERTIARKKKELPNVEFSPDDQGIRAPHFVFYIRDILVEKYGEKFVEQGGLKVTTSLDFELQKEDQKIVAEEIAKLVDLNVGNGAAVVLDSKKGEILAMVGSKDFFAKQYDGQVNVALSLRQPGSALKPFTYATGFKAGYTPATVIMDVPTEFPGGAGQPPYKPVNYDGTFKGPVQVRFALGNSINIAAVKMTALVGVKNMLRTAFDSGIKSLEPTDENLSRLGLAVTLGGGEVRLLELATGYATLANEGNYVEPAPILKIEDRSGKVLEEKKDVKEKRVLGGDIVYLISHILSDNVARTQVFGANSLLRIPGKTVAVKTGTTDDKRDNWAVGYTPSIVVGTWVGNNDNSPMNPQIASGVTGATPIWNRIMSFVLSKKESEEFNKPDNVIALEIDSFSGGLPCRDFPKRSEFFIKGTEPTQDCLVQKTLDGQEYYVFLEFDPVSTDGRNRWQEGIDALAASHPDSKFRPPGELKTEPTQDPDEIKINIKKASIK